MGTRKPCAPLIDWLRVVLMRQADGLASRVQLEHPRIPLMLPKESSLGLSAKAIFVEAA
jgi:hypothetical protein